MTVPLRAAYDRDGVVIVPGLFAAADIAAVAAEADRLLVERAHLTAPKNLRSRWQANATGGRVFDTFDPVIDIAPACGRLAHDPRLLDLLHALYGEPARLFKDKLIYKSPGTGGYGLHQDWIAWDGFPRSFLTAVVALDPAGPDNGCTVVYPGRHRGGPLAPADGDYHDLPATAVDESAAVPLVLDPGDVAVFGGFTPHRSGPNRSARSRRQLYLSYNAASDGGDQRDAHYRQFHAWLRRRYDLPGAYIE